MFKELIENIKNTIKNKIPELKQVDIHGGGFSGIDDVSKFVTFAPAVKVGISDCESEITNDGRLFCLLNLSILLVTKDKSLLPNSRYLVGLDYLEKLLLLVKEGVWKSKEGKYLQGVYKPEANSIKNKSYFGPQLFAAGVAIWVISWQQRVIIGNNVFEDSGELPKQFDITANVQAPKNEEFTYSLKDRKHL